MIDDLCAMFKKDVRADVRLTASNQVLALTGSAEGRLFIRQHKKLVRQRLVFSFLEFVGRTDLVEHCRER